MSSIRAALRRLTFSAALIAAPFATIPAAKAWGPEGHRIVGQIAADQLNPAATRAVAAILADEPEATLAGVANWADDTRTKESGPLHYLNFPRGSCTYLPARDCPDGRCVIAAIEQSIATLTQKNVSPAARNEALKNLVHFVGDLHQPLHAGRSEDRGGNTVQLQWQGEGSNLHQLWDSLLIRAINPDWRRQALRLAPPKIAPKPMDSAEWARESCAIVAASDFYPTSATPDEAAYLARWQPTLDQRLSLAGLRLAALLNGLLVD